jgi:hypothetical protein
MITITTECAKCNKIITEDFETFEKFNIAMVDGTVKFSTDYISSDKIVCRECINEYEKLRAIWKEKYYTKTKQWWENSK